MMRPSGTSCLFSFSCSPKTGGSTRASALSKVAQGRWGLLLRPWAFSFDPKETSMPTKKKKPTPKTKSKPEEPVMPYQPEKPAEPVEEDRAITHEDFLRMQKRC